MEELRTLLRNAEESQNHTLQAIAYDSTQVCQLKGPVLLLLGVLSQCDTMETRCETLKVIRRMFAECSVYFYDAQSFLEAPVDVGEHHHVAERGNAMLKSLLATLRTLSARDNVDEETTRAIVDMVHTLCLQSMNATDVVALFDFLRLGRPPARRWILQMQKNLVEFDTLPRAIFSMRGSNAGLIVPSEQQLFTKRGYSCSFGIHLDAAAKGVALYSFRGHSGQGVSAMLDNKTLMVKMVAGQGVVQHVEVPFAEYVEKMERGWVHLCIVHAKKMVFKDKLTVYVDGKSVFNGNLGYPDPLMMVGGRNTIGIEPLVDGLKGKLWSPTLFGVALSEAEVQRLHWQTHWKNDLNSVAAENVGLADKSKFCFCYDARSCDLNKRICFDVSGNDCHGLLGPGTSAYVTQSLVHALDSVGGCACFLLLLLDQIPEMADFHPTHEFGMGEISDLLAFVGAGLRHSTVCRSHFVRLHGVKVVEFILQTISPSYLSVSLLDGVVSILEASTDYLDSDEKIVEYIYRLLFFNTSWFLSPFDTQTKLLGEVLPKYLQILQKASLREHGRLSDHASPPSGKLVASRAASISEFSRSLDAKDQVDVAFFCRLISQVYVPGSSSDKEDCASGQMDAAQLAQLRELVVQKLIDLLLFPSVLDQAADQWRQLVAFLFRQCEETSRKRSYDSANADIEAILRYLTQNLSSTELRKGAVGLPSRQLQLTTNMFNLSKGTVRALWRPMLSTNYSVRLAALRLFELYTSEKVLLHKGDMLMLYSSLQAHTLTADVADLLLDIVIGRKRLPHGNPKPSVEVRTGSFSRMTFIPLVLLGLIHNGSVDVQAHVLMELRLQLASPTMGDSVKEAIRSWPSWMSRLRSLTLGASAAAAANMSDDTETTRERSLTQSEELNEACGLLSADSPSVFAKLEAVQTIAVSGDVSVCDFALSLIQNRSQNETVTSAIIAMVIQHFPQRWCELVCKLANHMIVDIVVYCILHVKNGWMHFLEFYYCLCRAPSVLCSLTAAICENAVRQASQKHSMPQSEIIWENLCQVAAMVSQSSLVAIKMSEMLRINDAILSPGQQAILSRKAFELWHLILPHLGRINWDNLVANLVQNADYGSELTPEETEIFTHLVASRSQSMVLALQVAIRYVAVAQTCSTSDLELIHRFHNVLEMLKLIASLPVATASQNFTGSLSPSSSPRIMSPPVSGSALPDMALSLPLSGIADSSTFFTASQEQDSTPDRELVHLYTLDSCFTQLEMLLVGSDIESIRLLVNIMVALANTALHLRDPSAKPELTKTLQIMSSTDLSFYNDVSQVRELFMLWKLHRENHHNCCDPVVIQGYVDQENADLIRRWLYVMENHTMEFNPYLIQQHASAQAKVLGNELQQCEILWKEITDEDEAAEAARANEQDTANESRVVELKRSAEKFASSVHKLLALSSHEDRTPQVEENETPASSGDEEKKIFGGDGVILKIDSRENKFRMRLRLKKVTEDYRARNLSCEYAASSATDTESGKRLGRRFHASMDGGLTDLEHSWRSDAGSDYSDFLADAQMRAAIIRSLSNPDEYESAYGGASDDDDLDAEDMDFYDAEHDDDISQLSSESRQKEIDANKNLAKISPSGQVESPVCDATQCSATPIAIPGSAEASSSPSPVVSLNASPPISAFSLGASVLTVVGGVADYFQKSVNDAKDVVEYGVDSLYTTKDVVSEEAQALIQEVSTYIDSTPGNRVMAKESLTPDVPSLELTPSSLRMMETKLASDKVDDSSPELFPASSNTRNARQSHEGGAKRANAASKVDLLVNAQLVRHLHVVEGKLILSNSSLRFLAERVVDEHETVVIERKPGVPVDKAWRFLFKRRLWKIDDIVGMYRRRYLLRPTALELFIQSTRKNFFFNLASEDVVLFHEALMARRPLLLKRDPSVRRLRHPSSLFRNSPMSTRWIQHEISTFEYIMWLNTIAGRTYNDLTQYPVFPWIISDYESATLDLGRRGTYRDLTKPMGALEPSRLKFYVDRYHAFEDPGIPKFMYGTHYSNIGAVLYYLIRLEPFTSYALSIQGGKFDHADRLFHSVAETWNNCLTDYTDLKELTPEWFYLPDFLVNCNGLELGTRQSGVVVSNVVLPPWARSPEDFVMKNLVALESEYVSANIHHWIDLVFGCKQRGAAAVEANNVFFYLTYEGMVDVDSITDPIIKSSMQSQIAHFGQTPTQVLREPHPQRRSLGAVAGNPTPLEKLPPPSSELTHTVLSVPHEAPIVLVKLIPGSSLIVCLDSNGMFSSHRFGPKPSKSQQPTKGVTTSSSSGAEQSSEFIELQDRKSRKVLGEKRSLSNQLNVSNSIASLHGGMVICTVGHHDFSARFHSTADGALLYRLLQHQSVVACVNTSSLGTMLALGCTDGTISVWKVASMNLTLLDSLKIFRGSRVSSKPVHASDYSADQVLLGHNAQINCVSASDELGVCVSGSASNECLIHDLVDGSILHSFRVPGHLEPGVISLALSDVGHVVLQSMGTGTPMLYSFHLNGTLMAQLSLGDVPMTSLSICARYSKVVVSNSAQALVMTAHTLDDQRVLLERDTYGEISSQGLAPDELHAVFGVGSGNIVCLPLLPPQLPLHRTEI